MKNLKLWRESRGMSQKFVAVSLGVKPPQVSKWESEATEPTIENLVKLAALYGVTVDALLGLPGRDPGVDPQEAVILDAFRRATPEIRTAVCAVLGVPAIEKSALIG